MPKKERVLPLRSPRDHRQVKACVVWCSEPDFRGAYHAILRQYAVTDSHFPILLPGGATGLATPDHPASTAAAIRTGIILAVAEYGARTVILGTHRDCQFYGGLAAFGGDAARELEKHGEDHKKIKTLLAHGLPMNLPAGVTVELLFTDSRGIYRLV